MSLYRKYIITATAIILLVPGLFSWILFKINMYQLCQGASFFKHAHEGPEAVIQACYWVLSSQRADIW
jgi:hypothetical protein